VAIIRTSSDGSEPRELRPQRSWRKPLVAVARFVFVVIVFPILLGAVVLALLVNSARGHAFLIDLMQKKAGESLGVNVHLQNFNLHLASLNVDLYGLTIDGAGPHPNPPLLQVQHAEAGVRIVSLLGRDWYFDNIRIDSPVVHVYIDKDGNSNLPTFKSNGNSSNTTVFDLGIRHAVLVNGAIFYNDKPSSLALDLRGVQFNATYNYLAKKYSGTLAYADGRLNYSGNEVPTHLLNLQFDATPTTLHLAPARIQAGNTNVILNATLNNYSAPSVEA
jgi:translocation and assembly module TamB